MKRAPVMANGIFKVGFCALGIVLCAGAVYGQKTNSAHPEDSKKSDSTGAQAVPSHAESITVQLRADYTAPQGCILLVTGSAGGTTICPKLDTGTAAKSGVLTDPQPCSIHFGTADASINRTRYCTDVARESPE